MCFLGERHKRFPSFLPPLCLIDDLAGASLSAKSTGPPPAPSPVMETPTPNPSPKTQRKLEAVSRCFQRPLFLFFTYSTLSPPLSPPISSTCRI